MLCNPGGSVQWPKGRCAHSSVLINNSTGPHLLVVGGYDAYDCWLFDINKRIWKQLVSINKLITLILKIVINSIIILIVIDLFNYYFYNSLIYQTLSLGDIIILSQCGV